MNIRMLAREVMRRFQPLLNMLGGIITPLNGKSKSCKDRATLLLLNVCNCVYFKTVNSSLNLASSLGRTVS